MPLAFKQVIFDGPSSVTTPCSATLEKSAEDIETTATTQRNADLTAPTDDSNVAEPRPVVLLGNTFPDTLPSSINYSLDSDGNINWDPWVDSAIEASKSLVVPPRHEETLAMVIQEVVEDVPPSNQESSLIAGHGLGDARVETQETADWTNETHKVTAWEPWSDKEGRHLELHRGPAFSWGSGHQETFYMNVWDKQCLYALHPAFKQFGILEENHPIVWKAILSLSACHMSRMLPQRKAMTISDIPGLAFRPQFQHQTASQGYYQQATQQLRAWAVDRDMSELNAMLAAMILFCSLESLMGNFSGFNIHSDGVNTLLRMRDNPDDRHDSTHYQLQDAWRQTNILNWWRRFHFSTPEFQNTPFPKSPEIGDPRERNALFWPMYHRVDIMTSLCEYLSVVARAIIRGWNSTSKSDVQTTDLEQEIAVLDEKVISWYGVRTSSQRFAVSSAPIKGKQAEDYQNLPPLRYGSHEAAMNAAYWAVSQVFKYSAQWTIDHVTGTERYRRDQHVVEIWVWNMLRIAVAIDWESCVRYNTHTIGLSGLLLACAIRSQKIEVGLWVEDWLEERRRTAGLEEGSFPVLQILQIIRVVNRERRRGFDVCAVFNTADDGGGAGKFQSYHSQVIDTVMVYAICRETGEHVRKEVPV